MRMEDCPTVISIEEIQWGQAFQFRHRDGNYIGIKAFIPAGSDRLAQIAVIWPSHPNKPNEPGIYEPAVFRGKALVPLTDAVLIPSHDLNDRHLDDSATGAAGSILLSPDMAPVMPVRTGGAMKYLDLESSELLDKPRGQISAQIVKWSVVRKILGEFRVIAQFQVAT
jgi:hypothetical protein